MKNILLIEDNVVMRENTTEILQLSNYLVMPVENGRLGLEYAAKNLPDLIICDIELPGIDGFEVIRVLNETENTKNIPFIFLTAYAEKSDMNSGFFYGANDYITKPYKGEELLRVVDKYLGA